MALTREGNMAAGDAGVERDAVDRCWRPVLSASPRGHRRAGRICLSSQATWKEACPIWSSRIRRTKASLGRT